MNNKISFVSPLHFLLEEKLPPNVVSYSNASKIVDGRLKCDVDLLFLRPIFSPMAVFSVAKVS